MIKLTREDIGDPNKLRDMAKLSNMSKREFIEYFSEVIE